MADKRLTTKRSVSSESINTQSSKHRKIEDSSSAVTAKKPVYPISPASSWSSQDVQHQKPSVKLDAVFASLATQNPFEMYDNNAAITEPSSIDDHEYYYDCRPPSPEALEDEINYKISDMSENDISDEREKRRRIEWARDDVPPEVKVQWYDGIIAQILASIGVK